MRKSQSDTEKKDRSVKGEHQLTNTIHWGDNNEALSAVTEPLTRWMLFLKILEHQESPPATLTFYKRKVVQTLLHLIAY
jgi:hypothetical protein